MSDRAHRDVDRGASEVVGVVLLVGIVMLGALGVVLVGGPILQDRQAEAELQHAEGALTEFDATAERVATGSTGPQHVDLGLRGGGGTLDIDPDAGNITVEYISLVDEDVDRQVLHTSLGAVTYERGGSTVAYQGGGVWRSDGGEATMVSPPQMTLREKTFEVPVVRVADDGSVHTNVALTQERPPDRHYPNASAGYHNMIGGAMIHIYIESAYYEAWGQYFEEETGAIVQYDHEEEMIVVVLTGLPIDYSTDAGVITTATTGQVTLEGTGSYVDSYDSREGSYAETVSGDGLARSAGGVDMSGDAQIDGDVEADTDITIGTSTAQIDGNASAGNEVYPHHENSVTGAVENQTRGVHSIPPIDPFVEQEVRSLQTNNDNDAVDAIEGHHLDLATDNVLPAGEYYLEHIELEDETLVLDATQGNITIGVEDWITLGGQQHSPGHIRIEGDHEVQVYVNSSSRNSVQVPGEGSEDLHFAVLRGSSIETAGDRERATQFQVLGPSWFDVSIAGSRSVNSSVTGMIIAPAGPLGTGELYVKHADVYGSTLSGNVTLGQYGAVHFDHAIKDLTIPIGEGVPRVEYLYVTEHELRVAEVD